MEPCNCIITIGNEGYQVVGPFETHGKLLAWGRQWQKNNGDDPRWQSVYLADPDAAPRRVTPQ